MDQSSQKIISRTAESPSERMLDDSGSGRMKEISPLSPEPTNDILGGGFALDSSLATIFFTKIEDEGGGGGGSSHGIFDDGFATPQPRRARPRRPHPHPFSAPIRKAPESKRTPLDGIETPLNSSIHLSTETSTSPSSGEKAGRGRNRKRARSQQK